MAIIFNTHAGNEKTILISPPPTNESIASIAWVSVNFDPTSTDEPTAAKKTIAPIKDKQQDIIIKIAPVFLNCSVLPLTKIYIEKLNKINVKTLKKSTVSPINGIAVIIPIIPKVKYATLTVTK